MNTSHLFRASLAALAAAVLAAGCRTPPEENPDAYGEGSILESEFGPGGLEGPGDLPLAGTDFSKLAPVAPPAEAGIAPVYFSYNESAIPAAEQGKVANAALFLMQNPGVVLVVEGNCDERGTNEYNMSLGEFRAQSIRNALVAQGVAASRVQTASYGEEKPVAFGHDEASWRRNRRGDFAFFQGR
ncbi:MAG: OmpA family protein [Kiritimatiellae bacterium]|nr:OmpA family protein [Kiritimatiellia bacterium]